MKRINSSAGLSPFFVNRRRFLQTAQAAAALAALPAWGADAVDLVNAKAKRVGLIGCGWYGKSDLWRLIQVAPVDVVSLCDPDTDLLTGAADLAATRQSSHKRPRTYRDYREMLREKDLDIVIVGSPDHWHALHTIAALEAGADVYCQKPVSRDVREGEAMVDAARKHKRVIQVGTQRKSTPHLVEAKKQIIEGGRLGKIGHIEMCCYFPMRANGNPPLQPVPQTLDYELWTGPAPLRPYDGSPHVRWWRTFKEYGNGILGDMCVHLLDTARWMLGLGWPRRISSTGGIFVQKGGKSNIPDTQTATFEFDDFNAVWQHRSWGQAVDPDYPWGLFLHGEKGLLKASTTRADFIPYDKKEKPIHFDCVYEKEKYPEDITEKDIELNAAPATRAHMLDFLAAVATRGRPLADIEQGHISTAACILANIAMDVGRPVAYDPKLRIVTADREATNLLRRPYRKGWKHPHQG
ncbi:MAG: Gfo/Idh/MocA family oxidoreductase [Deltaproteobacteria bacterium]|nr:Gfo/Idh/MocA family oxidoreductase [Deltaproteobacteria bacterium]